MANVDGVWDVTVKSPMGEQKSVLTLKSEGNKVTGTSAAQGGQLEILDGKIDGSKLSWRMELKQPFAITLLFEVTINGDKMEGTVTAGSYGKSPLAATRRA
jgi:hypothetical protein